MGGMGGMGDSPDAVRYRPRVPGAHVGVQRTCGEATEVDLTASHTGHQEANGDL